MKKETYSEILKRKHEEYGKTYECYAIALDEFHSVKRDMKLYLLTQDDNVDYDTYHSCVLCAESPEDAITICPDGQQFVENKLYSGWAKSSKSITCTEIGIANENQKRGAIVSSYNAG